MDNISFCTNDDFEKLQNFIHEKWKHNHVLAIDKTLFDFQHKSKDRLNFVISKNENNEITGILGFIPISKFDEELKKSNDLWLAIWKVDENKAEPGTGFSLLKWLEKQIKPQSIASIGINNEVKRIYNVLGYKTGILNQYFIANPTLNEFKISSFKEKYPKLNSIISKSFLKEISIEDIDKISFNYKPLKSQEYIKNRYINHPTYKYFLLGAYNNDQLIAFFVIRKIYTNESSCLRIVDIQGDLSQLDSLYESIVLLLKESKSEYIDCLNFGLSKELFFKMGFSLRNNEDIIPNYFEPFEKNNIDVFFVYKSKFSDYIIFKGDSDQDRPNIIQK